MGTKIKVLVLDAFWTTENDEFDFSIVSRLSPARHIAAYKPDVIITTDSLSKHEQMMDLPLYIRRKWIHFDVIPTDEILSSSIRACFAAQFKDDREFNEPVVSVVTPTYNTDNIWRAYQSLNWQTYKNWHWFIYDDGSTNEFHLNSIQQIAMIDPRVTVINGEHSGYIGEVKRRGFSMAWGDYLVELDHDDQLMPNALQWVVEAFDKYPDAGFCYTDCSEVLGENFENSWYPEGWGFGYGVYYEVEAFGRVYNVAQTPSINSKTIRHIVGVPNHLRAWRKNTYHEIGGHCGSLFVVDDYELIIRTFLHTRMVHINRFGYIQYHNGKNAQESRRGEIQILVNYIANAYEEEIRRRFEELGIGDFIFRDGVLYWDTENPAETPIANYVLE